jgi:uncharacterized protein YjbI with pentapeptide repeats
MTFDALDLDESTIEAGDFRRGVLTPGRYELVDWEMCEFGACSMASTTWVKSHFTDTAFYECDLANTILDQCGLQRVEFEHARLTGFDPSGSTLQSVAIRDSVAEMSVWRFSKLERAEFRNCRLAGSDWNSATLDRVTFAGCDLTGADFHDARLDDVTFTACDFAGIKGVTGLRGATVDAADLLDLTVVMAGALGIRISTADTDD